MQANKDMVVDEWCREEESPSICVLRKSCPKGVCSVSVRVCVWRGKLSTWEIDIYIETHRSARQVRHKRKCAIELTHVVCVDLALLFCHRIYILDATALRDAIYAIHTIFRCASIYISSCNGTSSTPCRKWCMTCIRTIFDSWIANPVTFDRVHTHSRIFHTGKKIPHAFSSPQRRFKRIACLKR